MSKKIPKSSITLTRERIDEDLSKHRSAIADLPKKMGVMSLMDSVTKINKGESSIRSEVSFKEKWKTFDYDGFKKKYQLPQRGQGGNLKADILYLMDCTSSMGMSIQACKDKILQIGEAVRKNYPGSQLRQAFVGYRDYGDSQNLLQLDFVGEENLESFESFMQPIKPEGGKDFPEDLAPALKAATNLSWSSPTKLLIHFADAPCHGTKYYSGSGDDYPGGSPTGIDPEDQLKVLYQMKIDYYFARVGDPKNTSQMVQVFEKLYNNNQKKKALFQQLDSFSNPQEFIPLVVSSVMTSITKK